MILLLSAAVWQQRQLEVTPAPAVPSAPRSSRSLLWVGHRTGFWERAVKGNTSSVLPGLAVLLLVWHSPQAVGGCKAAAGAEVRENGSVTG